MQQFACLARVVNDPDRMQFAGFEPPDGYSFAILRGPAGFAVIDGSAKYHSGVPMSHARGPFRCGFNFWQIAQRRFKRLKMVVARMNFLSFC